MLQYNYEKEINMPTRIIVDQLTSMRNQLVYHMMMGEYKEYVALRKDFAKKYVKTDNWGNL